MATSAPAVIEKTDAELIADEVAAINKQIAGQQSRIDAALKAGKSPEATKVNGKAMIAAEAAMKEATDRSIYLASAALTNIIENRERNVISDVHAVLNLYSTTHPVKITAEKNGSVTIVIS